MPKLITYNFYKSTGMGGIQTFIRSIQRLFLNNGYSCIELFHDIYGFSHYDESGRVEYRQVNAKREEKLDRLLRSRQAIKSEKMREKDVLLIFNPKDLLCVPVSVFFDSRVILVQSSRFDIILNKALPKLALLVFGRLLYALTVYTEADKTHLISLYPGLRNKIYVIPRGCIIPTAKYESELSKNIVTISRIDHSSKNFSAMLCVMKSLPASYSLHIYGAGEKDQVEKLKKEILDFKNIKYMGPTHDVKSTLNKYSLFIMTSRYEGFGQTLIEARSQGLPVVLFNTFDNASWVVKDGKTGALIEPWDYEKFARTIEYLLSNDDVYKQFSRNSLMFSKETDANTINNKWLSLIDC